MSGRFLTLTGAALALAIVTGGVVITTTLDSPIGSANDRLEIIELPNDPPGMTCNDYSDFQARERIYATCLQHGRPGVFFARDERACAATAEAWAKRRLCVADGPQTYQPLVLRGSYE